MTHFFHFARSFDSLILISKVVDSVCALKGDHSLVSLKNDHGAKAYFKNSNVMLHGLENVRSLEERRTIITIMLNGAGDRQILIYDTGFLELLEGHLLGAVVGVYRVFGIRALYLLRKFCGSAEPLLGVIVNNILENIILRWYCGKSKIRVVQFQNSLGVLGAYERLLGPARCYDIKTFSEQRSRYLNQFAAVKKQARS